MFTNNVSRSNTEQMTNMTCDPHLPATNKKHRLPIAFCVLPTSFACSKSGLIVIPCSVWHADNSVARCRVLLHAAVAKNRLDAQVRSCSRLGTSEDRHIKLPKRAWKQTPMQCSNTFVFRTGPITNERKQNCNTERMLQDIRVQDWAQAEPDNEFAQIEIGNQ